MRVFIPLACPRLGWDGVERRGEGGGMEWREGGGGRWEEVQGLTACFHVNYPCEKLYFSPSMK